MNCDFYIKCKCKGNSPLCWFSPNVLDSWSRAKPKTKPRTSLQVT